MGAAAATSDDRIEYRYEVQSGDTVYDIASRMATKKDDVNYIAWSILKDNNLKDAVIIPGQEIVIRVHPEKK
jgi:LysM repeat protein